MKPITHSYEFHPPLCGPKMSQIYVFIPFYPLLNIGFWGMFDGEKILHAETLRPILFFGRSIEVVSGHSCTDSQRAPKWVMVYNAK